jgi:hypothetical protein
LGRAHGSGVPLEAVSLRRIALPALRLIFAPLRETRAFRAKAQRENAKYAKEFDTAKLLLN